MVRSFWIGPPVVALGLTGVWGAEPELSPPAKTATNERIITVQELDMPALRCRVLRSWRMPNGFRAMLVQAVDNGEILTVVESGQLSSAPSGSQPPFKAMATKIYHWGLANKPPPGAPMPPVESDEPARTTTAAPVASVRTVASPSMHTMVKPVPPAETIPVAASEPVRDGIPVPEVITTPPTTRKAWPAAHSNQPKGKAAQSSIDSLPAVTEKPMPKSLPEPMPSGPSISVIPDNAVVAPPPEKPAKRASETPKVEKPAGPAIESPKVEKSAERVVETPKVEKPDERVIEKPKSEVQPERIADLPKMEKPPERVIQHQRPQET